MADIYRFVVFFLVTNYYDVRYAADFRLPDFFVNGVINAAPLCADAAGGYLSGNVARVVILFFADVHHLGLDR